MARSLKAVEPKAAKPSKPKILIYGAAGVGKTWASLEFPSVYYIDTEGGANLSHYTDKLKAAGGVYLGPEHGANDFNVVIDEITTLATTKHQYRTLVIDSYSKLFGSQIAATAEKLEKDGKKNEFAADKKPAVGLTRRMVRWCDALDMNVILICHERPMWLNGEQVGFTFDGYEKLAYELHLAMRITKEGNARKAKVVKSRLEQFPDASSFDWSYGNFADRFGRAVMEAPSAPIELATDEQRAAYEKLLSAVKVDQKILDKWEENCPDLNDLDRAGMQKRIDYLNGLLPKQSATSAA